MAATGAGGGGGGSAGGMPGFTAFEMTQPTRRTCAHCSFLDVCCSAIPSSSNATMGALRSAAARMSAPFGDFTLMGKLSRAGPNTLAWIHPSIATCDQAPFTASVCTPAPTRRFASARPPGASVNSVAVMIWPGPGDCASRTQLKSMTIRASLTLGIAGRGVSRGIHFTFAFRAGT